MKSKSDDNITPDLMDEMEDEGELDEDEIEQQKQIIQTILMIGNDIWRNFGQEDEIDEVEIFFQHQFYIQCFQMAYPEINFYSLLEGDEDDEDPEKMAKCIQAIVDLLSEEILKFDMNHIRGDEIVNGNPEHCINLLQILHQISSASLMQEDDDELDESDLTKPRGARSASAGASPSKKDGGSPKELAGGKKGESAGNKRAQEAKRQGQEVEKQQLLDNIDDLIDIDDINIEQAEGDHSSQKRGQVRADKVGEVLGQELDIEFDDDIKDNLQNMQGRRTGGSSGQPDGQNNQHEDYQGAEDDEGLEDMGEGEEDSDGRLLNRQTDNMANLFPDGVMEGDGSLDQFQEQLQKMDGKQVNEFEDEDQHHSDDELEEMIDPDQQNIEDLDQLEKRLQMDQMEDEDGEFLAERDGSPGDEEDMEDMDDDFGEIDPELYEAAQNLGLDDAKIRELQKQMYQQQLQGEDGLDDDGEMDDSPQTRDMVAADGQLDDENDIEGQELAEMLNGVQDNLNENKQILHGSQEINDEGSNIEAQKRESPSYGDEDDDIRNLDQEMAQKLKEINAEPDSDPNLQQQQMEGDDDQEGESDGEGSYGDENEVIDLDKLNDQEKAILLHYLQDQYNNSPELLPMPKEVVEHFLMANKDLLEKKDEFIVADGLEYDDDDIDGGEELIEVMPGDQNQGIDSSEIVVENDGDDNMENDQEDAMIIQGEKDIELDDEEEKQLVDGEINIQGGEQNINEDGEEDAQLHQQMMAIQQENAEDYGEQQDELDEIEQQQMLLQQQQNQQYGNEEDDEALGEGEEEDEDPAQQQVFGPQYALDEIQENDQEDVGSNMVLQNMNLQAQHNLVNQQQLGEQQQYLYQQQLLQQQQAFPKKVTKKKLMQKAYSKKMPVISHGGYIQRQTMSSRPLTAAASKKFKRSRIAVNTINHDDQAQRNQVKLLGIDGMNAAPNLRSTTKKTNSQKRPQTAKPKRSTMPPTSKPGKRYNNYMSGENLNFGMPISSTPNYRKKITKTLNALGQGASINSNMIVPQQSQIFTSFGLPQSAMSQRKASSNPRKKNLSAYGSVKTGLYGKKKSFPLRATQVSSAPKLGKQAKKTQQKLMKQQLQQQQQLQLQNQQQQNLPQHLVEMPILSEEFLNRLNEEQLQALLEQQQQLMMLQQQSQQNPLGQPGSQQLTEEQAAPMVAAEGDGGVDMQSAQFTGQGQNIEGLQTAQGQAQQIQHVQQQQEMLKQQIMQMNLGNRQNPTTSLRNRSKQNKSSGPQHGAVARIPSNPRKADGIFGSASRSRGGSKKRNQKTRSSMTLSGIGSGSNIINVVNPATLANQVPKSKNLAAQIYGTGPAENMLNNLISNRKKGGGSQQKKGTKKRAQPNQLGNAFNGQRQNPGQPEFGPFAQLDQNQQYNIQAQLQTQQAPYNMMQQPQVYSDGQQQFQVQIGPDGQPQYIPVQPAAEPALQEDEEAANEEAAQNMEEQSEAQEDEEQAQNDGEEQENEEEQSPQDDNEYQMQQQKQQMLMKQMQQQQLATDQQSNILPLQGGQISNIADDLSTEQIIELLQNAAEADAQLSGELGEQENFDENGEPIAQQNQLPEEIQIQLQQVLQQRMIEQQQQQQFLLQQQQMVNQGMAPGEAFAALQNHANSQAPLMTNMKGLEGLAAAGGMKDRVQSYQNMANILTESVSKAKERYRYLAPGQEKSQKPSPQRGAKAAGGTQRSAALSKADLHGVETDQRIQKQRQQFETLLKQYKMDMKVQENKRQLDQKRANKMAQRDEKIQAIRQKKFEEQMLNQQRSQMYKRNAQQVRLCKKVYKLASDLEKNKLLDEKKFYKESEITKHSQKKAMVQTIENYYKDKIDMLKDRIGREKRDRQIAQEAQKKALNAMKKELDEQKRKEVNRYISLLQQEDDKYDMQNLDLGRFEGQIVKLYKKA